jgi:hypothetical protein
MMFLMLSLWEGRNGWRNASGRFYRINSNDGLLSDNQNWDISLLGTPCHCVSLSGCCRKLLKPTWCQNFRQRNLFKSLFWYTLWYKLEERVNANNDR